MGSDRGMGVDVDITLRGALEAVAAICDGADAGGLDERTAIYNIARSALAAPVRNCDVGTAEEQMKRQYDTMCNTTTACPDSDWSCRKCFAQWAQMPYNAKEGDGNGGK